MPPALIFFPASLTHLEVCHVFVALLGASVIRQLNIPEAGQLVHQEGVLFDHRVEDVLQPEIGRACITITSDISHLKAHLPNTVVPAAYPSSSGLINAPALFWWRIMQVFK